MHKKDSLENKSGLITLGARGLTQGRVKNRNHLGASSTEGEPQGPEYPTPWDIQEALKKSLGSNQI